MPIFLFCFASMLTLVSLTTAAKVVAVDDVNWGLLNPLRGEKSPKAATLWGDRTSDVASGVLVKFNQGFSSPPHIHNVSYRGVVIDGLIHNDVPKADKNWMQAGSYWSQPAGQDHITAASGDNNLIYLEIDHGPYLVKPSTEQFNNGEQPVNLHASCIHWQPLEPRSSIAVNSAVQLTKQGNEQIKMAPLWGGNQKSATAGLLLKLPQGFSGQLMTDSQAFKAVLVKGKMHYQQLSEQTAITQTLMPGSFFDNSDEKKYQLKALEPVVLYIRTEP